VIVPSSARRIARTRGDTCAGRLQDHAQGLAGDRRDALHRTSSLPGQLFLDASIEIIAERMNLARRSDPVK